ncbi:hypothetical protein C8Q76DRAFT_698952 [Earliella scabrosa]|nr:hypothetical protein C8Q76DRAFT_698952 [Earliella scabrosa]
MKFALFAALAANALLVAAQSCPEETYQSIIRCTDQVYADEGKAPCSSSDWECICQVQQGLISCYEPCPEEQDFDAIRFNNENCAGQHGVSNKAGGGTMTYTLSPITTTGPGSNGATPSAPNSSPTSSDTATGSQATETPSTDAPSNTGSADDTSPSNADDNNAAFTASPLSYLYVVPAILLGAFAA